VTDGREPCALRSVCEVEFRSLSDDLGELKVRVRRLESALARGVLLLIANLVGVITVLAQQLVTA
jgi:hypothetical protein